MIETFDIAGYARISVDDEQEQKNISIENQKAIIEDYVKTHFPGSTLMFFEDRDRSGYTFDQREGYQEMRRGLMQHKYDILIIKDFSRFSRRNSRGLVELEDLRDAVVRINRVQTETVDKQGGVGFDVFGLDVFKAKRGDDQGLEFGLQFFFRHLYWGASRFIGPVQRVGF